MNNNHSPLTNPVVHAVHTVSRIDEDKCWQTRSIVACQGGEEMFKTCCLMNNKSLGRVALFQRNSPADIHRKTKKW
jgi:hypothetical protein